MYEFFTGRDASRAFVTGMYVWGDWVRVTNALMCRPAQLPELALPSTNQSHQQYFPHNLLSKKTSSSPSYLSRQF
jgi:hypothetical protein